MESREASEKLTVFDPEKPLYQRLHVCEYLRELEEEVEGNPPPSCAGAR
ncbi:MAG: hypothetical protein JW821_02525 [Deltaproteobacteria bacterium]|nr:hypothetical protein [Deltaproteobacteria bacterium]